MNIRHISMKAAKFHINIMPFCITCCIFLFLSFSMIYAVEIEPGGTEEFNYTTYTSFCPSSVSISYSGEGEVYFSQDGLSWISCFLVGSEYLSGAKFTYKATNNVPGGTYEGEFTIVFSSGSSSKTITKSVIWEVIGSVPIAKFSVIPTEGTVPLTVEFTNQSSGEITSYLWDFGDGNTDTSINPLHIYTDTGSYSVSLIVFGPEDSDTITYIDLIEVYPETSASFSASPTTGEQPLMVQFTDNSAGEIDSWEWDFGDGNTSDQPDPINTYLEEGVYTVRLIVHGSGGSDTILKEDNIEVLMKSPSIVFGKKRIIDDLTNTNSIYSTDLDGDGDQDVLSGSMHHYWHENLGYGFFGEERLISNSYESPSSVYAADLDGDGDQDVLSNSLANKQLIWYENFAEGSFGAKQIIATTAGRPGLVQAADFDNDGDIDVLSAFGEENRIAWYENLNNGTFGSQQVIKDSAEIGRSIQVIDFDGDGDQDVLAAFRTTFAWYENVNNGSLWEQKVVADRSVNASSGYGVDFDNDGDMDVLGTNSYYEELYWFKNTGDGSFEKQIIFSDTANIVDLICPADLDNDGDQDILATSYFENKIVWYENIYNGFLGSRQIVTSSFEKPRYLLTTDLDGDGDMDVVSISKEDLDIAWFENLSTFEASFFSDKIEGKAPLTIHFTDNSSGDISTWLWDFGDGNTNDEKNPTHSYNTAGVFTVSLQVMGDGGNDTLTRIDYITVTNPTGLTIGQVENGLKIYPNPTNDRITIETDNFGQHSIEITSLKGQLVYNKEMNGTTHHIDFSSFHGGTYFITIKSKDFVTTKKIIKL